MEPNLRTLNRFERSEPAIHSAISNDGVNYTYEDEPAGFRVCLNFILTRGSPFVQLYFEVDADCRAVCDLNL